MERHFHLTACEADGVEYVMMKEGDLDWERKGETIIDLIQNHAEVEPAVAEDIQVVLERRHYDVELARMGEENPFGATAQYAESGVDDTEPRVGWLSFEHGLKTEARYFSRMAEWTLQSVFEGIAEHSTHGNRPIVVEAGPNTAMNAIYRARVFQSNERVEQALRRPDLEIGPPPSKFATAGRMNPHGISVFYGATDPMIALAEVRPPVASMVIVGRFELIRPLRLLDVEALRVLNVEGSVFDTTYFDRLQKAKFLKWLSQRITLPIMPDDEPYEYLPTQAIADFLAGNADPLLHGIVYPSVQGGAGKSNVVLFHKAARVQPMDIPNGTEISVSSAYFTEDGEEIDYRVSEEVPPPAASSRSLDVPGGSAIWAMPPESVEYDSRESFLKLDVSSLQVHHVRGITFKTDAYPVTRHRSNKQSWDF